MSGGVTPARMAAYRALLAMERSRAAHCDDLLRAPAMEVLSPSDRNLATALVMGVAALAARTGCGDRSLLDAGDGAGRCGRDRSAHGRFPTAADGPHSAARGAVRERGADQGGRPWLRLRYGECGAAPDCASRVHHPARSNGSASGVDDCALEDAVRCRGCRMTIAGLQSTAAAGHSACRRWGSAGAASQPAF